jgi:hypothetical protein
MADEGKPEEGKTKKEGKKLLPGISWIPLDGIVLVVVPFIVFVLLFLHLMGFLPPQPVVVHVIDSGIADSGETAEEAELTDETDSGLSEVVPMETTTGEGETPVPDGAADGMDDATTQTASDDAAEVTEDLPDEPPVDRGATEPPPAITEPVESATQSEAVQDKKIKQLAKVYEQMNASSVAAIVTNMSDVEAIDILSNMKPRNAAKVLASLDPERAAALSLMLAR